MREDINEILLLDEQMKKFVSELKLNADDVFTDSDLYRRVADSFWDKHVLKAA